MSLLSQIALKNSSLDHYFDRHWSGLGGGITKSGTIVSQQTALRLSTLLACIRVRTESFGSIPCSIYKKRKGGGRDEAYDHPLYELIHNIPNEDMTALTWRESLNMNFDADGNCYSIIDSNKGGNVIRLTPVPYYNMEPCYNEIKDKMEYRYNDRGKIETLPASKVYHVPGFSWDGLKGISIIRAAAETFGRGLALDEFTNRFFGQGMNFGLVLEAPGDVKDREALKKEIEEKGGGLHNSHRPMLLTGGMKLNRVPISFVDAQLIEMMNLTDIQICALMRVPPHMVAHLERATFSNIEHQGIEFVTYSQLPTVVRHEQEIRRKLLTQSEREQGYYAKFNMDALLRGDAKTRAEALAMQRQNGKINANEWRALDDENPIEGLAGEAYLVQMNMTST
ncbi:MAG: phage portal protein, partial [Firmicutes bacterium]|nr:phage portal protein [Bacillota bacterium]